MRAAHDRVQMMTIPEILKELEPYTGRFPMKAMRAAFEQHEAITPELLRVVETVAKEPVQPELKDYMLALFAVPATHGTASSARSPTCLPLSCWRKCGRRTLKGWLIIRSPTLKASSGLWPRRSRGVATDNTRSPTPSPKWSGGRPSTRRIPGLLGCASSKLLPPPPPFPLPSATWLRSRSCPPIVIS